ncbi:MAG: FAD-binding protein, partial [Mailhella sp.]|nr:FAD-binding protein [Mailhella sp.]
ADLHAAVEAHGLFYPPDPGSMKYSSIGGNIAENAGGMRAVKYGVTSAFVMGLEVVLPNGEVIHTGSKCIKDVVGFNIAPLFIGSEGMLGIITKAYLRLVPLQKCRKTCRVAFSSLADAVMTVTNILQTGVVPLTLEFMDQVSIEAVGKSMELDVPDGTGGLLIIEAEGSEAQVSEDIRIIVDVCRRATVLEVKIAETREEREFFWKARRSIPPSLLRLKPRKANEDIVVPRSKISEMCEKIKKIAQKHDLTIACFGHAGDGNIHANVLFEDTEDQRARASEAVADLFRAATSLGGRISGEHGVGISKQQFISLNIDEATLAFMKRFKKVFDPKGLLNPGKVFPDET